MREILFKARRVNNGEWVEGLYSKSFMGSHTMSLKSDGVLITDQIDPETLCQFTGAITADGKRMFEGDILTGSDGHYKYERVIIFNQYEAAFKAAMIGNHEAHDPLYGLFLNSKIKGNIHDENQ